MIRTLSSCFLIFLGLPVLLLAGQRKHPPVASAARETTAQQLHAALGHEAKVLVIDVRTPAEYARGHIPEAVNIPISVLPAKIRKMDVSKNTTIVTMCDHGGRSSRAALELQKMGYRTASFCRIDAWKKNGYKIKSGDAGPSSK
jgi:rhodanese-related sulfurtransferase